MAEITTLIDKQDTFEIVRDQIAAILATEIANQMALATAAFKDPEDWRVRIFTERFDPWEQFLEAESATPAENSPIVNVQYDNGSFPEDKGDVVKRQMCEGIYNLDCYALGISEDVPAGGHLPGDKDASFEVQKTIRLIRNILMASSYTYLQLQGTVGKRWIQSIDVFQPQINGVASERLIGARLALKVTFNEFSPQYVPATLELISIDFIRAENGEILFEADYPS